MVIRSTLCLLGPLDGLFCSVSPSFEVSYGSKSSSKSSSEYSSSLLLEDSDFYSISSSLAFIAYSLGLVKTTAEYFPEISPTDLSSSSLPDPN